MNIRDIQSEIENIFDNFNRDLFNEKLPQPIITIQSAGRKDFLGWCTTKKVWKSRDGSEERYEIAVTAEHLSRPIEEIAETLLHEACHLFNLTNNIKDYSGLYYHNKKYKVAAEAHGLNCEDMPVAGWAKTSFNDVGWEAFKRINIDLEAFDFAREVTPKKERKPRDTKPKYKYLCSGCDSTITSKKEIHVQCLDCDMEFELQEE